MAENKVSIEAIRKQLGMIPGLSTTVMRLLQLLNEEDVSIDEIEKVILMDQSIAAKIISIANSAYYGYPGTITSVREAIIQVIGLRIVKSLALSLSLINNFKLSDDGKYEFRMSDFWLHSFIVANLSRELAKRSRLDIKGDTAYLAGLLHDIGIVVFNKIHRERYSEVISIVKNGDGTIFAAEEQVFGVNHQEVGELLCQKWNIPNVIRDVVAYHHRPEEYNEPLEFKPYVYLTHFADNLVKELNIGYCGEVEFNHNEMQILKELKIDCSEAEQKRIKESLKKSAEMFECYI